MTQSTPSPASDRPPDSSARGGTASAGSDSPWKRPALIVAVLIVALGGAWFLLRKPLRWRGLIANADRRDEYRQLREDPDPALVDRLESALGDTDLRRDARVSVGMILVEKNRLLVVERAARAASLDARTVALEVLARQPFFRKQYADDSDMNFRGTLLDWLKDGSRADRDKAIQVLPQLVAYNEKLPDDLRGVLRSLATSTTAPPAARWNAAASLAGYRDCGAASEILAVALVEEDVEAKHRELQAIEALWQSGDEECRGRMPVEKLRSLVSRALAQPGDGGEPRATRMAAMGVIARHLDWGDLEAVRRVLDSNAHEVERRSALEAMVSAGDAKTLARLPAYLHDESGGVRSTAWSTVRQHLKDDKLGLSEGAMLALTVGYLSFESDVRGYEAPLRLAWSVVQQKAGAWVGLPEPFRSKGGAMNEVATIVHTMLAEGAAEGVTRAKVADELFLWLAGDMKLAPDAAAAALKARTEFWAKARAGDTAGAKAVYDGVVATRPDLFAYERGWLLSKGAV